MCVFGHFLIRMMVPLSHVRTCSSRVWALVWTTSVLGHWEGMIEISGDTHYYCITQNTVCWFTTCLMTFYFIIKSPSIHIFMIWVRHIVLPCLTITTILACPSSHYIASHTYACLCMPLGFILRTRWVIFWQPRICLFRSWSLDRRGSHCERSGFSQGAVRPAIRPSHPAVFWPAHEIFTLQLVIISQSFVYCKSYFCASRDVILNHVL